MGGGGDGIGGQRRDRWLASRCLLVAEEAAECRQAE